MARTVMRPGGVIVASKAEPYRGFLVNTCDPLAAIIVMALRYGLNSPKERPGIGSDDPGCQIMLMVPSWKMCPVSVSILGLLAEVSSGWLCQ